MLRELRSQTLVKEITKKPFSPKTFIREEVRLQIQYAYCALFHHNILSTG